MGREPRQPTTSEAVAALLRTALTEPAAVTPGDVDTLAGALRSDPPDHALAELALAALAAVLYACPELAPPGLPERLAGLARIDPAPARLGRSLVTVWGYLAATPAAPAAWAALRATLLDERLPPDAAAHLVRVVRPFVEWREDLVGVDGVLDLSEAVALAPHRALLLEHGLRRLVFCAPEAFTPERLERMASAFGELPGLRHALYALAERPGLPAATRAAVAARLEGAFPFHALAAARLRHRPVRLLAVLNVGMGQGDDVVRLGPLLQGLLDGNPALTVTLVTRRTYLYDSPRVTPVAIGDDEAVSAALAAPFDGVIEFFQPGRPEVTLRHDLHDRLAARLAARPPAFRVAGDLGLADPARPAPRRSAFLYQRVELDGRDVGGPAGLDRAGENAYDPALRLLAELGLPQRAAEEPPRSPSLLTGTPSPEAERVWRALLPGGPGPVALVSPFGGSRPAKGFLDQDALLAAELAGLIEEGYRLVLLPLAQAWAGRAVVARVLARLPARARTRVGIAPEPVEPGVADRLGLAERPELGPADRVMRLFKYFAAYADLVVTVEGWLVHLAYQLGRPFRLFLAAGSLAEWLPPARGPGQRLVATLSPRAAAPHAAAGLLGAGDPPPLPHQPRKALLEVALGGLARAGDPDAVSAILRAAGSPDPGVRQWAVAALGETPAPVAHKAALLAALDDRAPGVVRTAAETLLRARVDCGRELGEGYRGFLQAHVDAVREDWEAVARIGAAALPVLFRASRADSHGMRAGAKQALRQLLAPYLPALGGEDGPPDAAAGGAG